jgi:hypothetical protein
MLDPQKRKSGKGTLKMTKTKKVGCGGSANEEKCVTTDGGRRLDSDSTLDLEIWWALSKLVNKENDSQEQCAEVLDYLKARWEDLEADIAAKAWEEAWRSASLLVGRAVPDYIRYLSISSDTDDPGFQRLRPLLKGKDIDHMLTTLADSFDIVVTIRERMLGTEVDTAASKALVRLSRKAAIAAKADRRQVSQILGKIHFSDVAVAEPSEHETTTEAS